MGGAQRQFPYNYIEMLTHLPLPAERQSLTHKFRVGTLKAYLTVGLYPDGRLGEVFIRSDRMGSLAHHAFSLLATVISVALQHGVPLERITSKMIGVRGDPEGWTSNSKIPYASSVADYVGRWLQARFGAPPEISEGETKV